MATTRHELELPSVPPSQNTRRGEHWAATRRRKAQLQADFFILLTQAKLPKLSKVHATASIRLPKNRRRDEGNYRDALEKALGDALQLQWLPDDTPEHFTFGAVVFEEETGAPRTRITLEVE